MTNQEPILTLDQLVQLARERVVDIDAIDPHYREKTLDVFMNDTLDQIMYAMILIPTEREINQSDIEDDPLEIATAVHVISKMIGAVVGKTATEIESILLERVNKCPIDDIRQARMMRHKGTLN